MSTAQPHAPSGNHAPVSPLLNRLSQSVSLRAAVTAFLALLMLIPMGMVSSVVSERSYRYQGVLSEIANAWGQEQTVSGPVLTIPYTERITTTETIKDANGKPAEHKKTTLLVRRAHFLPKDLQINSTLLDEIRSRSIFTSVVFRADIELNATFDPPDVESLSEDIETIHWDKAFISVGVSDTRAINKVTRFDWNNQPATLSPGTQLKALNSGFHAMLSDSALGAVAAVQQTMAQQQTLTMKLNVNGSGGFFFTPHGERTQVEVSSVWPHPSFQGDTLPDSRNIDADGFTANWDISHLARNYAQSWAGHQHQPELFELTTGVRMFEPDSLYNRITRATKYGVLFIGLTFLTLFIFELAIGQRIHLMQYALIGLSLSLFYLILLSLSEHITFVRAYAAASLTCTAMISIYTGFVLKSPARGVFVALLLSGLYALLYSLIKMEDFALLMGTLVLLLVVIVLMVVTRNLTQQQEPAA